MFFKKKPFHSDTWGLRLWKFLAWALGLTLLAPVLVILLSLFSSLSPDSTEAWQQISSFLLKDAIKETIILVIGSCVVASLLGIPAAWFIENFDFPGKRLLSIALVLPLAIPPFIAAIISSDLREKLIPFLIKIRREEGVESFLWWEENLRYGCLILLFGSLLYPYVFLAGRSAFAGSGIIMGEAGRMLGRSPWRVFSSVQLPLARPALAAGIFLVAMEVINDYGAVKHFGFNTLTVTLFTTWFGMDQIETAKKLASWILISVFFLVALEHWHRGRALRSLHPEGAKSFGSPSSIITRIACYLSCLFPISLGLILPLFGLIDWLLKSSSIYDQIDWEEIITASRHTLILALSSTVICLATALTIIGAARFSKNPILRVISKFSTVAGYACPGTVIALGVMGFAVALGNQFPSENWIGRLLVPSGFIWLLFAIVTRYFSIGSQMVQQGLARQNKSLDQSSFSLGKTPTKTFFRINLPLLKPSILGGATLVFVDVCKELPLCLLLRPFDFETLSTLTYSKVDQGAIYACAIPSLFLISVSMLGLIIVELNGWRKLSKTK